MLEIHGSNLNKLSHGQAPANTLEGVFNQGYNPFTSVVANNAGLTSGPGFANTYFAEMKDAIGKNSPDFKLSEENVQKYHNYLSNAAELLTDTIKFSERGSFSEELSKFREQESALKERMDLTRAIGSLFSEGKALFSAKA